ncbi:hypothetical protein RCL_jg15915.t1 [Rhizophagus clarus]|uniref:Uncharacterized protein n=1 Tax=Rhizophagus clarus TaxID=94130 RepID=A0A8H3LAH5_9GLOM|nr:hypothetical protein RCL_jg15915.t1 [Rhizophagus clarus]
MFMFEFLEMLEYGKIAGTIISIATIFYKILSFLIQKNLEPINEKIQKISDKIEIMDERFIIINDKIEIMDERFIIINEKFDLLFKIVKHEKKYHDDKDEKS